MSWPVTDRFTEALTKDHFVAVKAEILDGEQVLAELASAGVLISGSVTCSRSEIQRSASVTLVDRDGTLTPRDVNDLLVPGGRQIRLWRGIMFNDRLTSGEADIEYVPLGTFRFTTATATFPRIELTDCYDRAWIVQGNKLENNLVVALGTNVINTIGQLLQSAYPGVPMNLPTSAEVTNAMVFDAEADQWATAQTLAANLGMRLYFDPMGVVQMRPETDESDPIVWDFDDLSPTNISLPGTARTWQGQGFNAVIVLAENSNLTSPLRAVAYDTDPDSPTQYGGVYGRRLAPIIRDETISTQSQASLRAVKELQSVIGLLQSVKVPTIVLPHLEVGDVVRVALARTDATDEPPISEQFCVVDGFDVPLTANATQTLETRARRIVSA